MLRAFATALLFLTFPILAQAQERPSAILVLDASGSMWGQIDGVNKIVIARDVVTGLLETLPAEQELGLVTYGHRRKGDCSDIELLYEPGTDRNAIAEAVMKLNPKGKTPLSAAVIQAAEALRYQEEAATVILVSDGIETCNYDPCEVGRTLEELGVNFTAHVVGFDVDEEDAKAQLQCLAEETGGTFREASDAGELASALTEVATAPIVQPEPEPTPQPEPEAVPADIMFQATDGENGPPIASGLIWTITAGGETLAEGQDNSNPVLPILRGTEGTASVTRLLDEVSAEVTFTAGESGMVVTVALPAYRPPATLTAPDSAPAGSLIDISFDGPEDKGDYITVASPEMKGQRYHEYTPLNKTENGAGQLRMPPEVGLYEIRYVNSSGVIYGSRTIEATPFDVALTAPTGATVGVVPEIDWTGPDYKGDYITVSALDQGDAYYKTYAYTRDGNPLALTLPSEPGTYELRYVLGASREVAARSEPFEVAAASATVAGPGTASAGSTLSITWTGPDAKDDYIAIAAAGSEDRYYETYSYTRDGSPLEVKAPIEPGEYEIRYVLGQDRVVLARQPLTLGDVGASVSAPGTAIGGEAVTVTWTGPDYQGDYIATAAAGSDDGSYITYTYTNTGSPLTIELPTEAGEYEIRYVAEDGPTVLARTNITVEDAIATLDSATSAPAGSALAITWTGPNTKGDYITVSAADSAPGEYVDYAYTVDGSPTELDMPTEPGTYELRYVQDGKPLRVIGAIPVEVTEVTATLTSTRTENGLEVTWEGPNNRGDYVTIVAAGADAGSYLDYAYTRDGQPTLLDLPEEPGSYELRYVLEGKPLRVISSVPLTVE